MTDDEAAELYGKDAVEWLSRWDSGRTVWSIEMGGLGPGYEQCIQIVTAAILRHFLLEKYDAALWSDKDTWKQVRDATDKVLCADPAIKDLGLSGAQAGAAYSLAAALYKRGPMEVFKDEKVKDRHIQVSKTFPQAA